MQDAVGAVETHVSVLFFVHDRAYKLKKPVALDVLDFTTREARAAACHREVALNRRLAPDVYLGVLDIQGSDGRACDHLVVMRRMPADRRLSRLVTDGLATVDDVERLAHLIAAFHAAALAPAAAAEAATADAVRANWEQSFRQLEPFVGGVLPAATAGRVEHLAQRYLDGRAALFDRRIAEGRARDGHGDLLADDIFLLEDGPRVLDCIEFSDRLRYGDVLADVAFLAMDLERLGAPRLADHFLERWGELMGETHPASLAHHYIAYRALVRCKVACVRHGQGDPGAGASAGAHLELARRHLERGRVVLALVGGLPGTGKSTVAEGIGRACGWTVLRSDEVRQELTGDYTPESVRRTYEALVTRAEQALHLGLPVVLDATWGSAAMRELAAAAAARTSSDLVELRCVVDPAVAARRIATRREAFGSEATPAVATALATRADPWPSAVDVDTEGDPVEVLGRVLWNLSTQR